ncbi:hypothetical protein [Nonomuraea glycinis]|nr:hypothetical protein OHA68_02980 [Nonomuraea glycinis]
MPELGGSRTEMGMYIAEAKKNPTVMQIPAIYVNSSRDLRM